MQIKSIFRSFNMKIQIFFVISLILHTMAIAERRDRVRFRLCSPIKIPNAIITRHSNKIMRIKCVPDFTLQGNEYVGCENGKWNALIPVCAKRGCAKPLSPLHGTVMISFFTATLFCTDQHKVAGAKVTYCNGTHWDRPLGECRESSEAVQLECDFETEDLCGWYHDETHNFDWKRIMAANIFQQLRTGPQHDHTTLSANAGHYMLMESFDQPHGSIARLISPIFSKNLTNISGCFKFYYFMYGATVGSLNVYIKPTSVDIEQMLQDPTYQYFNKIGNQKNVWHEGLFNIQQMTEDFQIVIEGTAGSNHLSDIAVDDVKLMPYVECFADSTALVTNQPEYTEYAIYDIQSCEGRCNESSSSGYGIKKVGSEIIKMCDCNEECETLQTCCLNYRSVCNLKDSKSSTELDVKDTFLHTTEYAIEPVNLTAPTIEISSAKQKSGQFSTLIQTTTSYVFNTERMLPIHLSTMSTPITPSTVQEKTTQILKTTTYITEDITTPSVQTSPGYITHVTSKENYSEKHQTKIKEQIIAWNIGGTTQKHSMHPASLIIILSIVMSICILAISFLMKYLKKIRAVSFRHQYRYSSEYSETTTLTCNQDEDTTIES